METKAPATTRSITTVLRGSIVDREEQLPPPPSEPPVDEPSPSPALVVTEAAPEPDFAATIVQGSSQVEKVEAKAEPAAPTPEAPMPEAPMPDAPMPDAPKPEAPKAEPEAPSFAKTLAFGSKLNELPQSERVEAVKLQTAADRRDRLKEKRALAQEAQKAISPKEDPDEISVPPANDLNVEDEKFFSEADVAVRKSVHEFEMMARQEEEESVPEKARRKLDPHVIRRRERFAGYVKIAVAGAAIVCLAALGRSALHSRSKTSAEAAPPIAAAPEAPVAPKAAEPAAAPVVAEAPKADPKPAEPVAAAEAPKAEEPKAAEPAAAEAAPTKAEEIAGDAKEELAKSRKALEKRKIADAIEAGERSVALDPTDGEAWLILGAAYQEKGDMVNARRCYGACVKQGKTGPRLECQKMLRF